MKRILLVIVILLVAGVMAFAQQAAGPNKQTAQEYFNQSRTTVSQFESMLNELKDRNAINLNARTFSRIRAEMDSLESRIQAEANGVKVVHDRGNKVDVEILNRMDRMVVQYKEKQAELEALISGW